jgi:hypothetical protein
LIFFPFFFFWGKKGIRESKLGELKLTLSEGEFWR